MVQRKSRTGKFVMALQCFYLTAHMCSTETNSFLQWSERFRFESVVLLDSRFQSCFFQRIPKDQSGIREEIARMKAERIARRAEREAAEAKSTK